jgi:hypothetical protein
MFFAWLLDLFAVKNHIRNWAKVRTGTETTPWDTTPSTSPPGQWPNGYWGFGETQFLYRQASVGSVLDPNYLPPNPPVFFNDDAFTSPFDQPGVHTGYPYTITTATCSLVHIANLLGYSNEVFDPNIRSIAERLATPGKGWYNPGNALHGTYAMDGQSMAAALWNEFVSGL